MCVYHIQYHIMPVATSKSVCTKHATNTQTNDPIPAYIALSHDQHTVSAPDILGRP